MNTFLFLCPHGAAKSVIAAAEFQRRAEAFGLPLRVLCGGTEPEAAIAPAVLAWLEAEGLSTPPRLPHPVTDADVAAATGVIAMNCDLRGRMPASTWHEQWEDVPPVSQDLPTAHAIILAHVERLIHDLRSTP